MSPRSPPRGGVPDTKERRKSSLVDHSKIKFISTRGHVISSIEVIGYLAFIKWGWVGYEEFCRSRRALSTEAEFNNCFIIHSKYFPVLKGVSPFPSLFFCLPKITQSRLQVFSFNGSIICSGLHFWRHWFNMTNLVNSSWLWWIVRVVLTNRKQGNVLNE